MGDEVEAPAADNECGGGTCWVETALTGEAG